MSSRLGRPTDCPKTSSIKIRIDEKDGEKLDYLCKKLNTSKSEIVRAGIDKVYKENK